jgi:hypothetical protein
VTGINLKTLKRWTQMPEFASEYRRVPWQVVDQAYVRAQQHSGAATTALLRLMSDSATPPSNRIRAAPWIPTLSREALDMEVEVRMWRRGASYPHHVSRALPARSLVIPGGPSGREKGESTRGN